MDGSQFLPPSVPLISQSTQEIIEPDWDTLIRDQVQFANPALQSSSIVKVKSNEYFRKIAHDQWTAILSELSDMGTLGVSSLDLAKRLVFARIRLDMAHEILFAEGFQVYDIDIRRMRRSYASYEISVASNEAIRLEDKLGLTSTMRNKAAKVPVKKVQRASTEFLGSGTVVTGRFQSIRPS